MTEELLRKLIEIVTNTAPELWRIANKQVVSNLIELTMWCLVTLGGTIASIKGSIWAFRKHRESNSYADMHDITGVLLVASAIGCGITFFALVGAIAKTAVNPEYYAIQVLMNLVK